MSPSFSAWAWRILKISSCLRSPLMFWTFISRAMVLSSGMLFSFSSDRFRPPPGGTGAVSAVALGWVRSRRALIRRLRGRRAMAAWKLVVTSLYAGIRGVVCQLQGYPPIGPELCQCFCSHADLDDGSLLDLPQPG